MTLKQGGAELQPLANKGSLGLGFERSDAQQYLDLLGEGPRLGMVSHLA